MDLTKRSNIGYTFWMPGVIHDYAHLIETLHREEYRIDEPDTYVIVDERSTDALSSTDVQEIDASMIRGRDYAIASILRVIRRPVLMVMGDQSESIKITLACFITSLMGEKRCTIITESCSIVNTCSDDLQWIPSGVELTEEDILILRGIQYSRGHPITSLYRLTSYLISSLRWTDRRILGATATHIHDINPHLITKGEYTDQYRGYLHLYVERVLPKDHSDVNLSGGIYKIHSLILDTQNSTKR